ncbi:unnamed protein product, partial [Brachionus calyciflorus]
FAGHTSSVMGFTVNKLSNTIASSDMNKVQLYNKDFVTFKTSSISTNNIVYINNNNLAVAVNGYINIYDSNLVQIRTLSTGDQVSRMKYLNKSLLVCGAISGKIMFYNTLTWGLPINIDAHPGYQITAIEELSSDLIVTGSKGYKIKLWNIKNFTLVKIFDTEEIEDLKSLNEIAFSYEKKNNIFEDFSSSSGYLSYTSTSNGDSERKENITSTSTATLLEKQSSISGSVTDRNFLTKKVFSNGFYLIKSKIIFSVVHDLCLIASRIEINKLRCFDLCSRDLVCKYVVYEELQKSCKIYRELTIPIAFDNADNSKVFLKL